MLVLFETPAGYALFKVAKDSKLKNADSIAKEFETPEAASKLIKLKAFKKFQDTTDALAAAASVVESKLNPDLKKFLKKHIVKKELSEQLAVIDSKLGGAIKSKLGIECVSDSKMMELYRGIRAQLASLVDGLDEKTVHSMRLGLGHSLSRYKLKFSPDKVDTMIVQAIGLLDELDKEINTYAMRVKEWYGWHFPELAKIVNDNLQYAKIVLKMGVRSKAADMDFSDIIAEEVETQLKETAIVSMGTDISDKDLLNIQALCTQVISMMEYRAQLFDYLKKRMSAIAPNLSMMVGELVGARLIAHAGSLLNLAKQPASTIQILGAEKALFRALKTKHETPKYGLIYHASLVGQSAPKNKGKVSRMLASKTALSVRVDALGESSEPTVALEGRAKVEARMRQLETGQRYELIMGAKGKTHTPAVASSDAGSSAAVNPESDIVLTPAKKSSEKTEKSSKKKSKRKASEVSPEDTMVTPKKSDSEKKEKKSAKKSEKKEKKSEKKEKKSAKKAKKSKE